jgi:hypothetical protein
VPTEKASPYCLRYLIHTSSSDHLDPPTVNGGTRIYERAWKSEPNRDDFGQLTFCGYVREAEYQKQQQALLLDQVG